MNVAVTFMFVVCKKNLISLITVSFLFLILKQGSVDTLFVICDMHKSTESTGKHKPLVEYCIS